MRNIEKNYRPFTAICDCHFGRRIIYTNASVITKNNIREELSHAMPIHRQNAVEINYLDRYYRGDQPILYRRKDVRPEVNTKCAVNLAYELVERKVAELCAEPMQYVLKGVDERKADEITWLNQVLDSECKQESDVEVMRWRSICGTAYRFIENDNGNGSLMDESDFSLYVEDPRMTFIAYYSNNKPAFSCQIRRDEDGKEYYFCYTATETFKIYGDEIAEKGVNGHFAIPVIEYPNNSRRLSDIEIVIPIMDAINKLSSDRINGIEQFVSAWLVFKNCLIDKEKYTEMRNEGCLQITSNNGQNEHADVSLLTNELNQTESQVVFNDLFDRFLDISGLSARGLASGGDTGTAVSLRNGHAEESTRTAINEPIIKKAEGMMLKIILNRLRITKGFTLLPGDVEIHINHNKLTDMLTKAEALQIMLNCGINPKIAIKTSDMFSDPERTYKASQEYIETVFETNNPRNTDTTQQEQSDNADETNNTENTEEEIGES